MRITMVGTGYVGLVTGTCLATSGNDVTCLDIDARKIAKLHQGVSPIYAPGLDDLIRRNVKAGRLHFTTDKHEAYDRAEAIFICVGTPSDEHGRADLKYVLAAAGDIGEAIEGLPEAGSDEATERGLDARPKIVVIKSTVPVGTNAKAQAAIAEKTAKPFVMASNPEFLKEGAAINDFMKPDRVVVGVHDEATGDRMRKLYEPFVHQGNPIFVMDVPSAEMVKYAANAMLATKISFINEMANLCEHYKADVDQVWRGMTTDRRIGNQFLYPGLGYGGSCFPKDVLACISMGEDCGYGTRLLSAVHDVNQRQRKAFYWKVVNHFGGAGEGALVGKKFGVWGIAFKPGTDDVREAPSITLMKRFLDNGAGIVAHDPVAHETCREVLGEKVEYVDDPYEACRGVNALIICTDWQEFKTPDFERMRELMTEPVVFDGRNLYRRREMAEYGFTYYSVGREPVFGQQPAGVAG